MMRIAVTSDLHLGITHPDQIRELASAIAAERPDLTVLAGDIGEGPEAFRACLAIFGELPGMVAVLAGNHDVWAREGFSSRKLWERVLPNITRQAGMLWLEDILWRMGDLAVAGTLGWYDYSAADPSLPPMPSEYYAQHKAVANADAFYVNWSWSDVEVADRLSAALAARLRQVEGDPAIAAVVVTHVPVVEEQIVRKPGDAWWSFSNAYFGNLTLGRRLLALPKLRAIISGHTHVGREAIVARRDAAPVLAAVIPSDYGAPAYSVLEWDGEQLAATL